MTMTMMVVVAVVIVVVVVVGAEGDMVVATQSRTLHARFRRRREHRECSFGSPYPALTRDQAPSAPK